MKHLYHILEIRQNIKGCKSYLRSLFLKVRIIEMQNMVQFLFEQMPNKM